MSVAFTAGVAKIADALFRKRSQEGPAGLFATPFPVGIGYSLPGKDSPDTGPAAEAYADVVVQGGRVRLVQGGRTLADLPVTHLDVRTPSKREVVLEGEAVVGGQIVTSVSVRLPSMATNAELLEEVERLVGDASPVRHSQG